MGLEDFELGKILGEGAVGQVLAATHRPSGVRVALKTARSAGRTTALSLERELAALAALDHPSILHLYDHGVAGPGGPIDEGMHWMALEFAGGGSLEEWQPKDWPTVHAWLVEILQGLAHAHARGVVHRDLKPANLVLCERTDVRPGLKIADFGLAWATRGHQRGLLRAGSPAYMPPEQIRGDAAALGPGTDLYAFGCLAWEWTTGEPPFGWLDVDAALQAQLTAEVGPFEPRLDVPAGLEALLRALLHKDIGDRPASAAHVLSVLNRLGRTRRPPRIRSGPLPVPARFRAPESAPSTAVLTGVGLGLFALRDPPVVGREAVQETLWTALRTVASENRVQVVALTGAPGIGRRRLARWLGERALELGCASVIRASREVDGAGILEQAALGPVLLLPGERADDGALAELASQLMLSRSETPVLIVLVLDEGDPIVRALERLEGAEVLRLEPLEGQVLGDFLDEHLGLGRGLADHVATQSAGNPGLAVAWVRTWVVEDALQTTRNGFVLRKGVDRHSAPALDDLQRFRVEGALRALTPAGRLALALGALLGTEVHASEWLPLLARFGLSNRDSPLRRLAHAGLVEPTPDGWTITDPAVRLGLIDELAHHGPMADFHWAAAEILEALPESVDRSERIGRHLHAAGDVAASRAPLLRALQGRRAEARWVQVRALVELLAADADIDGLSLEDQYAVRYYGVLAIANVQTSTDALPDAYELLALAERLEGKLRGNAYRLCAQIFGLTAHYDEARAAIAATDAEHPSLRRLLAMIELDDGDFDTAVAMYRALYDEGDASERVKAANGLGRAYGMRGEAEEAERWFRACMEGGDPGQMYVPLCNIAMVKMVSGHAVDAVPFIREAELTVRRDNVSRRGYVSLIAALVAIAAHERSLLEQVRRRALFHVDRAPIDDPAAIRESIATARKTALPEHRDFLDLLEARLPT